MSAPKLEGKFSAKAFADVLKRVEGNRGAAYLLVSDGLAEKCLYFSVGAIRLSSMGARRGLSLEETLLAHPSVTPEIVAGAREAQADTGAPFEEALAAFQGMNEVLKECSTAVVRDEVLDLLLWDGALFEYAEANPPPKIFDPRLEAIKLSFGAAKLIREAAEAIEKTQKFAARVMARSKVTRGPSFSAAGSNHTDAAAVEAITALVPAGGALIDDVVVGARRRGIDAVRLAQVLDALFERRVLDAPKREKGTGLSKDEEVLLAQRDVNDVEGALDLLINELAARQRLAKGYLALGEQQKAVVHLKRVGDELLQRNKAEDAVEAFKQIVAITPNDFGVREKIAFLYEKLKRFPEAVAEGVDLAKLYRKFGLLNRAKNLLRRIISLEPEVVDHRRELIDVLVKLKDRQAAVAEFENLAELFARRQQDDEVLGVYQQMLSIDPNHGTARAATQAFVRKQPGFWVPYVGVAVGFLVLVGVAALVSAEYTVLKAFRVARDAAFARVAERDYPGAMAAVDGFLSEHGTSRAAERAQALKAQLAELEQDRRDRKSREDYTQAQQLRQKGHVQQARSRFNEIVAQAGGTSWAKEAQDRLKEIEAQNEEAERLLRQVTRLDSDRKGAESLEKARELVRRFAWSDAAQRLQVKLDVVSTPSGAVVSTDGRQGAITPCTLTFRATSPLQLTLTLRDFMPETRKVDLTEDVPFPYEVELRRAVRWRTQLFGPVDAPPLVESDAIYAAGRDQRVHMLDRDGRIRWTHTLGLFGDVATRPLRAGRRIVVGDRTGVITAVDANTGKLAWRKQLRGAAAPIAAPTDDLVVAADEDGSLYGLHTGENGREVWKWKPPGGLAALPVATDDQTAIVVPTGDGPVLVLEAATRRELKRFDAGGRATAPVGLGPNGYVVATEGGSLRAFSRAGAPLWQARAPGPVSAAPLVTADGVFVGAGNVLVALAWKDGADRWPRRSYRSAIRAAPAARQNRLYVATGDGAVEAIVADTGALRWVYRTEGEVIAPPVPESDTVYVASTDFGLYAIRE